MKNANRCETDAGEPNWGRIANHLARKALNHHTPLPRDEIYSLAGLAVAMTRARYDPEKGGRRVGHGVGPWTCHYGWLQLLNLLRNEIKRRHRSVPVVSFTDLARRRAGPERADGTEYALQSALACRAAPQIAPEWLGRLTPTQRRIVLMRAGGWTLKEIALAHGRSRKWVHWRLRRVRGRLADIAV